MIAFFRCLPLATLLCALATISATRAAEPQLTPLVASVMSTPRPVPSCDGARHLVYELSLLNPTAGDVTVKKIEVLDVGSGRPITTLDEAAVKGRLSVGGQRGNESDTLKREQFGVAFLHVRLDPKASLPRAITHRISAFAEKAGRGLVTTGGEARVWQRPPVVIGPPLAGRGYVAADGCCDSIRHVRAMLSIDGRFTLSQRFAIDWEQVGADNRLMNGDPKEVASYNIFGKDVLAVANGTVVAMHNDLPEQAPGALPAGMTLADADGNFVVLDIGGGNFVNYAHMQPGSVRVKPGDRVRRGAVIGKVGNTGNSQAPHLHLHVMDGPLPLQSDGIPYVIDRFTLTAVDAAGTADFDKAEETGSPLTITPFTPNRDCRNALPLDLEVVTFEGRR